MTEVRMVNEDEVSPCLAKGAERAPRWGSPTAAGRGAAHAALGGPIGAGGNGGTKRVPPAPNTLGLYLL